MAADSCESVEGTPNSDRHLGGEQHFDAPAGLCMSDASGCFVYANVILARILGQSVQELLDQRYPEILHPDDRASDGARVGELLSGLAERVRLEQRYVRPDGEVRWVGVTATRVESDDMARKPLVVRRVVDITDWRRSEAERDRLFDLSPDLIATVGFDGHLKRVNPAWTRHLGWSVHELLAAPLLELLHPDDRETWVTEVKLLSDGQDLSGVEARLQGKDRRYRWIRWRATALPDERLIYVWGSDVTGEKEITGRLRRNEALLADAQELARIGSWEWDGLTRQMTWSAELFRIFGLNPQDMEPDTQSIVERMHPEDRERVRSAVLASLATGQPFKTELRIVRADGAERIVHLLGRSTAPPGVEPVRIVGSIQDVTEWRTIEAGLRESEERFRRLFEGSPIGVAIVDGELHLLELNAAFAEMLGREQGEIVGRKLFEFTVPEDAGAAKVAHRTLAGTFRSYDMEQRFVRGDGDAVWARVRVGLWDTPNHGFVLAEDITETKEAERVRGELDAMKDGFLRVASHDLQGPLTAIANLAKLLSRQGVDGSADWVDVPRRIADSAERLRRMVAAFLDVDRLYQGGGQAVRRPTDLTEVADGVVKAIDDSTHPLFVDVTPVMADLDPDQFEHILTNLLNNAIAHTPAGTPVWLRVEREADATVVVVEDAGPGVPEHMKESVFELFHTGDPLSRRTGIGLWTVARFAQLHGGHAWVEDRVGGGACFRVVLPPSHPDRAVGM